MERVYASMDDAARAWAREYLPKSSLVEHGALIYKTENGYLLGETFVGETPAHRSKGGISFPPNVIKGFVKHYLRLPKRGRRLCGFIHSHPRNCSNLPSAGDKFVNMLPFIKREYIAAYSPKYGAKFDEDLALAPCYCITDYRFIKDDNGHITAKRRT